MGWGGAGKTWQRIARSWEYILSRLVMIIDDRIKLMDLKKIFSLLLVVTTEAQK